MNEWLGVDGTLAEFQSYHDEIVLDSGNIIFQIKQISKLENLITCIVGTYYLLIFTVCGNI